MEPLLISPRTRYGSSFNHKSHKFQLNDKVLCTKQRWVGWVRFIGKIRRREGIWYGVRLCRPLGTTDGYFGSDHYFDCPANHGEFYKKKDLLPYTPSATISKPGSSKKTYRKASRLQLTAKQKRLTSTIEKLQEKLDKAERELAVVNMSLENLDKEDEKNKEERKNQFHQDLDFLARNVAPQMRRDSVPGGHGSIISPWSQKMNTYLVTRMKFTADDVQRFRAMLESSYLDANVGLKRKIDQVWGPDKPYFVTKVTHRQLAENNLQKKGCKRGEDEQPTEDKPDADADVDADADAAEAEKPNHEQEDKQNDDGEDKSHGTDKIIEKNKQKQDKAQEDQDNKSPTEDSGSITTTTTTTATTTTTKTKAKTDESTSSSTSQSSTTAPISPAPPSSSSSSSSSGRRRPINQVKPSTDSTSSSTTTGTATTKTTTTSSSSSTAVPVPPPTKKPTKDGTKESDNKKEVHDNDEGDSSDDYSDDGFV